jgi:SAM-dependent methyltransferase
VTVSAPASSDDERASLSRLYETAWWADARRIVAFVRAYVDDLPAQASLIGLDGLNGGTAETRRVAELLDPAPGVLLLDLGCGLGGPARVIAAERRCRVDALDPSAVQVREAQALSEYTGSSERVRFAQGGFRAIRTDGRYDGAYAIESLVHEPDKAGALQALRDALRPHARLVIADYVERRPSPPLRALFPSGYHPWSPSRRGFAAAGLHVVACEDRSAELARAYASFAELFGDETPSAQAIADGREWWQDGAPAERVATRAAGFARFLATGGSASRALLGDGRDNVLRFCRAQAAACRAGDVAYRIVVAERTS